ncbi:response regulator transcription factor [Leucobacter sp. UCMA 4100]|uniref:response regulator n=1 Tax=Leucobacter sp. UCMA 4100 TaxID=2810534 RepID=UPI0022EA5F43|nr:response regulator transcription factor [Leucobacter sp. UCMA 4100]MDA3147450.1 response regulator transcription factor [Leucobacter sp. UCMA 4100]
MIRLLLVDDQELVRSGFRTILETEDDFEIVGEAVNGAEAVQLAAELKPDVVCMDVEMPVMNGIDAAKAIVSGETSPRVLILTTFGHEEYLFSALAAGVSGFLLKTARAEQFIDAVRTVAAGQALLGPDVTRAVIDKLQSADLQLPAEMQQRSADPVEALTSAGLTEREADVLVLVAQGQSNAEIAKALFLGESTVKTHVSNVLRKLGVRDRIHAVVWAHTHGLG